MIDGECPPRMSTDNRNSSGRQPCNFRRKEARRRASGAAVPSGQSSLTLKVVGAIHGMRYDYCYRMRYDYC
jgi:hypothetical protein